MLKQNKFVLAAVVSLAAGSAQAADYRDNPFTLVYDGAITENVDGRVNIKPVTYELHGLIISANVYLPANYDPSGHYAAVAVAHPNGGTKEQVAGLYAQRLADHGYITIAADASYQGSSAGLPRNTDKPANRIEDIRGMADYLQTFPGVDPERIGLMGICGGGGYSLAAAQTDKRFKAVAVLSMFDSGRVRRQGYQDSDSPEVIAQRMQTASEAKAAEARGEAPLYLGDMSGVTPEQADKMPYDLYREGYYYYLVNYAHPGSTFRYTASSLLDLMEFDAIAHMELINQPLLIMAGEKADSRYMSEDAFARAVGTEDKEFYVIPGATHIQTYYVPEFVDKVEAKVSAFFAKHL